MNDFDDPLDLFDDDGDGVVEMSLLEEEERKNTKSDKDSSGCGIVLFLIGSTVI